MSKIGKFVSADENHLPLLGKVIYIDPGHGGLDPGAMYKNIKEAPINLEISQKLEETLTRYGAIVYMTRYGDYDLAVNNKRATIFAVVGIALLIFSALIEDVGRIFTDFISVVWWVAIWDMVEILFLENQEIK